MRVKEMVDDGAPLAQTYRSWLLTKALSIAVARGCSAAGRVTRRFSKMGVSVEAGRFV
jgi:hypothetical protein